MLHGRKIAKDLKHTLWDNNGYHTTKQFSTLYIDENKKSWYVIGCSRVYKYSDILDFSIQENGIKYKSNGGVMRAVVGGALFGFTGAIVGAATATRNTSISSLTIEITVNDPSSPLVIMNLLNQETNTSSFIYQSITTLAKQIIAQLTYMQSVSQTNLYNFAEQSERYNSNPESESTTSPTATIDPTSMPNQQTTTYSKTEATPTDYVVFDLETTGLDYAQNDIIEIGAIKYIDGVEVDRFQTYIKINKPIPQNITDINGISNNTIINAPLIRTALRDFISFIDNFTLIAYNSDFHMSFLQYNCQKKLSTTINNDVIDALLLAKNYLHDLPNQKLSTIKEYFGLTVNSHKAIDDCIVTDHLYQYCRQFEELKHKYIIPFEDNPSELNEKEVQYLEEIVNICEENGINRTKLSLSRNSKYLTIGSRYFVIARLKFFGELQYILLNVPYSEFDESGTEIKHTPALQSEKDFTRVFPETPEQLRQIKDYIPTRRIRFKILF